MADSELGGGRIGQPFALQGIVNGRENRVHRRILAGSG
jgi:hypothetical protein